MAEKTSSSEKTPAESGGRASLLSPASPDFDLGALSLLALQRTAGNQATGRLIRNSLGRLVQPKLRVGPPGDAYEREADRVADTVLRGPDAPVSISTLSGTVQRACAKCQEEMEERPGGGAVVQRKCHCQEEEEDLVQPKEALGGISPATPAFETRVNALRGGGAPLPDSTRSFFEPRFGHDFGAVRIHTGATARAAAKAVHARAFTVGNDVVFGAGEYSPETSAGRHLLAHELTHVVQQTPLVARRAPIVQREPESEAPSAALATEAPGSQVPPSETPAAPAASEPAPASENVAAPGAPPADPVSEPAAPSASPQPALIVEDGTQEVGPDQMTKSDFLARLRSDVTAAAEAGLAGTEHSTQGCPLIDFWFGFYERQNVERMNRDLPRFAGDGPAPTTAEGYISLIVARVQRSVTAWAETGEITGVPAGLPLPGMNLPGVAAQSARTGAVLFKARPGGAKDPGNPQAIRDQLGAGQPLDGTVRSRMESAFGRSFSHVRVHTDNGSAGLSERLNAKAFAVGEHVAFGAGEYRPGTISGDALIAHELAHVAQQDNAREALSSMASSPVPESALEHNADLAAAAAVGILWGKIRGMRNLARNAVSRMRSGLRLQRCSRNQESRQEVTPGPTGTGTTTASCCDFESFEKSDDSYGGSPADCVKTIKFTFKTKPKADEKKCVMVNWVQGHMKKKDGTFHQAILFDNTEDINFASMRIDSVDKDPVYWSKSTGRWNYKPAGGTGHFATDRPQPPSWTDGTEADLKFKMCLHCIDDVSTTSDAAGSGVKNPLKCIDWTFKAKYDSAKDQCTH